MNESERSSTVAIETLNDALHAVNTKLVLSSVLNCILKMAQQKWRTLSRIKIKNRLIPRKRTFLSAKVNEERMCFAIQKPSLFETDNQIHAQILSTCEKKASYLL